MVAGWPPPPFKKNYTPNYLTEEQVKTKALEIIELLETIPLGHALFVLDNTKKLLLDCHAVDTKNPQFCWQRSDDSKPDSTLRNTGCVSQNTL